MWIMAALSLVGTVVGTLVLCGVRVFSVTTAQANLLMYFCPVCTVVAAVFASIHYKVTDTHLQLKIAFWDMLGGRIEIGRILNIVKKDGNLYISYLWKGPDPVIARVAISPKKYDAFKALLTSKNAYIEFFDEDEQQNDENADNENE